MKYITLLVGKHTSIGLDMVAHMNDERDTYENVPNCWDLWWNNIRDYDVGLNRLHNQNSFRKI